MTFYDRAKALANRQLAAKGQIGAIRRTETVGGGPTDTAGGVQVTTDYTVSLAMFPVDQKDIDGAFVKAGDFRILVAVGNLTITPTTTDKVICSEGVLTIVDPGKFGPAGPVTHYSMIGRK